MRTAIASLVLSLAACGASSPADEGEEERSEEVSAGGEEAERTARLGCETLRESEIAGDFDAAVGGRLVERLAEYFAVEIPEQEVDRAVVTVAAMNEVDEAGLAAALRERGMTMATYREGLRRQLLLAEVARVGVGAPRLVSEAEVASIASPSTTPEQRARLRERLTQDRFMASFDRWLARVADRYATVELGEEGGQCVELWPEVAPSDLRLEGTLALPEARLLELLGDAPLPLGPSGQIPRHVEERLLAAYEEAGYVAARVEAPEPTADGGFTLSLESGALHHVGAVRIREVDEVGRSWPVEDGETLVASLPFHSGDVFSRAAIAAGVQALGERLQAQREEPIALAPVVEVHDEVVDVNLVIVVHDPDDPEAAPD